MRSAAIYVAMLLAFRLAGKRQIGQFTLFDLVLVLLVANAVQPAMTGPDNSLLGGLIIIATLVGINFGVAQLDRIERFHRFFSPPPTEIIRDGKFLDSAMDREGVSRFPGAEGRIPNFAGAKLAAQKLSAHRLWKRAQVVKANPDSPQTHARRMALEDGKQLIMAVPRLRDKHPFRLLDPRRLSKAQVREAATIKGALRHGRVVALEEVPEIDFVICGSVAVNLSGARIGKGGGFSDLEYGMLIDAGKIDDHTFVATTVHPIQILREHLMVTDHDLPVDLIATPRAVIDVERMYDRPRGILWDHLQPPQIHEIPVLERMGYA